jgi:type II protein arginine methyltransferase
LSEKALLAIEDAWRRLLTPDAVVIPRAASARGYLIGGPIIEQHLFAASWEGLDLSAFNLLAPVKLGLHLDRVPHEALSDDFEIFGFDLARPPFPAQRRVIEVAATKAGRCVGVGQWIRLDLDDTVRYENRPSADAGANGWMHVVYRFAHPLDLQLGQTVRLLAGHNRAEIVVALAPDAAAGRAQDAG